MTADFLIEQFPALIERRYKKTKLHQYPSFGTRLLGYASSHLRM